MLCRIKFDTSRFDAWINFRTYYLSRLLWVLRMADTKFDVWTRLGMSRIYFLFAISSGHNGTVETGDVNKKSSRASATPTFVFSKIRREKRCTPVHDHYSSHWTFCLALAVVECPRLPDFRVEILRLRIIQQIKYVSTFVAKSPWSNLL